MDFPIAVVSAHCGRDKYLRHKPNTALHTWWAQRPLAACRSVLLSLLLPDPCDEYCPKDFKDKARKLLSPLPVGLGKTDESLQKSLFRFIGDFANPDLSFNSTYLGTARKLVEASQPGEVPLVVDPFAGAGSIPFEANRLNCDTFASDLNPVACLLNKVILEEIPKEGIGLADEILSVGAELVEKAKEKLAAFYPTDTKNRRPIAYLWAKTVRCESPNCGAEIPLVRSFWLCNKGERRYALRFSKMHHRNDPPSVEFEVFEPKTKADVAKPNISDAKAVCLCCNTVLKPERVLAQLKSQHGGTDTLFNKDGERIGGAFLLAVITSDSEYSCREYRIGVASDYQAVHIAEKTLATMLKSNNGPLKPVPDETLPPIGTLGFRVQRYGITSWEYLFTIRQKTTIAILCQYIKDLSKTNKPLVQLLLSFALDKFIRHCNGNARWNNVVESVEPAFGSQTLPITWTFPESVPWGPWAENFDFSIKSVAECIKRGFVLITKTGQVELADATKSPLPDDSAHIWFTDPPYYNAVPYSDLSDFFYVWLKRSIGNHPLIIA